MEDSFIRMIFSIMFSLIVLLILFVLFYLVFSIIFKGKNFPEITEPEKQPLNFSKSFWLALLIVVAADNLFVYKIMGSGLGLALSLAAHLVALSLLVDRTKANNHVFVQVVAALISCAFLYITSNPFIQGLNVFFIYYVLAYLTVTIIFGTVELNGKALAHTAFLTVMRWVRNIPYTFKAIFTEKKILGIGVIKTALITFFSLLAFTLILSAADKAFSDFIEPVAKEFFGRTGFSIYLLIVFFLNFALKVNKPKAETKQIINLNFADIFVPSILLCGLFLTFIVIQLRYTFMPTDQLLGTLNMTYSEYVRKGFVELLVAVGLGILTLYLFAVKTKLIENDKHKNILKTVFFVLFTMIFYFLVSSFLHNFENILQMGLTRVRIIGFFSIFWFAGVLISVAVLASSSSTDESQFFINAMYVTSALVLTLNVINIDRVAASGLVYGTENKTKDYLYISMLSPDVVDYWKEAVVYSADKYNELIDQNFFFSEDDKSEMAKVKLISSNVRHNIENLDPGFVESSNYMGVRKEDNQYVKLMKSSFGTTRAINYLKARPEIAQLAKCVSNGVFQYEEASLNTLDKYQRKLSVPARGAYLTDYYDGSNYYREYRKDIGRRPYPAKCPVPESLR